MQTQKRNEMAAAVQAYLKHPVLYDYTHPEHRSRPAREAAYKKMGAEMGGIKIKDIEMKIKSLRTSFRVYSEKLKQAPELAPFEMCKVPDWYHTMNDAIGQFLLNPHSKLHQYSEPQIHQDESSCRYSVEELSCSSDLKSAAFDSKRNFPAPAKRQTTERNDKEEDSLINNNIERILAVLESSNHQENYTEVVDDGTEESFGIMVGKQLKLLPPDKREIAKKKICDALFASIK